MEQESLLKKSIPLSPVPFHQGGWRGARAPEGLSLLLQLFDSLLTLPEGLLQLEPSAEVSKASDQNTEKDGTENDEKERHF